MNEDMKQQIREQGLDPEQGIWSLRQQLEEKQKKMTDPMDRCLIDLILKDLPATIQ